jgi:Fur family zinc uptake transcriptional regulator
VNDADPAALARVPRQAEARCKARDARLTPPRRRVLAVACRSARPLGAYDILEAVREEVPRAAPPKVYRALDFLLEQGLVHKLETLHAYVDCTDPEHPPSSQFLICNKCGDVIVLANEAIADSLREAADVTGFRAVRQVVELTGTCAECGGGEELR